MTPKYQIGERVIILNNLGDYNGKFTDEQGVVKKHFVRKNECFYGVLLDNHKNIQSEFGLYWFSVKSIKSENKEREEIPMFKNYTTVEVAFPGNPTTYSHACYDPEIKEGDLVVVNTGHHGFALANVVSIPDEENKREVQFGREVICRVDTSKFNARVEARKRVAELKREMEKRMREAQELALYEMLAEKDPTLKGMLDEYKAIVEECK